MRSLLLVLALAVCGLASAAPLCQIVSPADAPPLVRQAAAELSAYLSRVSDAPVPIAPAAETGLPSITLRLTPERTALGEEEFLMDSRGHGAATEVIIRGRTPLAMLNGAYRLLREYGFGFYFDGDAVPPKAPATLAIAPIHGKPVFAIRGSLPWHNFFDSPTTWDDQDFRFFADQMIRSGQNFIGFHTYDGEPFAAYDDAGKLVGGEPLLTTENYVWGTRPLPADEFGFGTGRFFTGRFWGSDVARMAGSREDRIRAQKALLARGLAYASSRGVKTCLGFEVSGDPTDPAEQGRFRARLLQLLRDYPMLDYVWLWQAEAQSMEGSTPPPMRSQGGRVFRDWQQEFAYTGTPARMWEGMRVAYYGRLARQIMDADAPTVKLVMSGWGGDHHLHVSDYFPAWDKVLDKRIIFAALDDIAVTPQVSKYYQLSPERERWAIPWYEYDGDQWFPQANAHVFAQTVRDARAKGCQGQLAIHWRTKEVGEDQALCADYAWNPDRTFAQFFADYCTRRFGPAQGPAIGKILQTLDEMAYRWLGGGGQSECGNFSWSYVPDAARIAKLSDLRAKLAGLRKVLDPARSPSGALGRLDDTLATIDRVLLFNRIAGFMVSGGPVDRALSLPQSSPERQQASAKALAALPYREFADMLNDYAKTITSRGELGILATVNAKALVDFRDKVIRLQQAAGQPQTVARLAQPLAEHSGIVSDYQQTSVAAGTPIAVRCVAYDGAAPAQQVTLQYRTPGAKDWASIPMPRIERSVFEAAVPADAAQPGWVRYRIVAELPARRLQWPQVRGEPYRQVDVFPADTLLARQNDTSTAPGTLAADLKLSAGLSAAHTVRLTWVASPGLPEVAVERKAPGTDWQRLGTTRDWEWEDASAPPSARVAYRLADLAGTQVAACTVATPAAPAPTKPVGLTARPRGTAVRLAWTGGDLSVSYYSVERADAAAGPFAPVAKDQQIAPEGLSANSFVDRPATRGAGVSPAGGTVFYRVLAHGFGGVSPVASDPVSARVLAGVPDPILSFDFAGGSADCSAGPIEYSGPHSLAPEGGRGILHTEGGLAVPYSDKFAVKDAFTVAMRFRQTEQTQIPVLLSQGAWEGPGYFVQLFGAGLRFYVGGAGCLDKQCTVPMNQWHTVVCVYDGASLAIYLDGALLAEKPASGPMTPSSAPFTVARYTQIGTEWAFKGDVDFVRLYGAALEPWMVMRKNPKTDAVTDLDWKSPEVTIGGQRGTWHQEPRLVDTDHGRAADLAGGLTIPFSEALATGDSLTIETSFLLRSVAAMPVLVCQGAWPTEGYMIQILGKRLRFHIGAVGSLDCGPELQPNRWYALKCTYDGATLRAYLDGQPVGELRSDAIMTPSLRPLRIGRYEMDQPEYVVNGQIGHTRILATVE